MEKTIKSRRMFLRISDILVLLLCALAVAGYFILPSWRIRITVHPDESSLTTFDRITEESLHLDDSIKPIVRDVLQEMVNQDLRLEYDISFHSMDFIRSLFRNDQAFVVDYAGELIQSGLLQAEDLIQKSVESLKNTLAKAALKFYISQSADLSELYATADEIMSKTGMDDDWIDQMLGRIRTAADRDDATSESVTDAVMDVLGEVETKLTAVPEYSGLALQMSQQKDDIRYNVKNAIKTVEDENGHVQYDRLLNDVLATYVLLASEAFGYGTGEPVSHEPDTSGEPGTQEEPSSQTDTTDKIGTTKDAIESLKGRILQYLNYDVCSGILLVMRIIGISILFVFAIWLFLFIFTLVKVFHRTDPGVPVLWVPVVFGWPHFPGLVLFPWILTVNHGAIALSILLSVFRNSGSQEQVELIRGILNNFQISFSSGSVFSAIAALILFILCFLY